jgi:3-hydroxy-9,10-secoandrosta-1,3,5(10)-triene-9,17-dione monooxygenase
MHTHEKSDWLPREQLARVTANDLVNRTVALKPLLAADSREAERIRRPVDAVWEALRASGIFNHFVSKMYGGLEFGVDAFIDAMLPLTEGCSSTGWVASFCVEHDRARGRTADAGRSTQGGGRRLCRAPSR